MRALEEEIRGMIGALALRWDSPHLESLLWGSLVPCLASPYLFSVSFRSSRPLLLMFCFCFRIETNTTQTGARKNAQQESLCCRFLRDKRKGTTLKCMHWVPDCLGPLCLLSLSLNLWMGHSHTMYVSNDLSLLQPGKCKSLRSVRHL